jgi:hypothetical protein
MLEAKSDKTKIYPTYKNTFFYVIADDGCEGRLICIKTKKITAAENGHSDL